MPKNTKTHTGKKISSENLPNEILPNEILPNEILPNEILQGENLPNDFLKDNPQNIKALLEEFIRISYSYEKEVKDAKALYERLIETLPEAIWVYNPNGSFFYQNKLAKDLSAILDKLESLKYHKDLQSKKSAPKSTQEEITYQNKIYLIQTNYVKANDTDETQWNTLITATDITSQKRQDRLASMGQISAHLAHEIRNPIGSISLLISTLAKRATQEQKPLISELQKSIFRVERIIKATLLFSKGISANRSPNKISSLRDELRDTLAYYSFSKDIDFEFDFVDKVALFDKDLLFIALQNFLFNAIDAIEEGEAQRGKITLKAQLDGEELIFSIQDNGKPFDEGFDEVALFEPFVSTKLKGNGLGLALSKQIIESHQGTITLNANQKLFIVRIKRA